MNTYAMSDIHGEMELFAAALEWIERDRAGTPATLVLLGDYIDRGPDSRGVVNMVRHLVTSSGSSGFTTIALQGNHEDMMHRAMLDGSPKWAHNWLANGGNEALNGYEKANRRELDRPALEEDARFLRSLPLFYQDEHRIYVHAGLKSGVLLEEQLPMDVLWMRPRDFDAQWPKEGWGKLVVHGHTPHNKGHQGRLCIDGGCCFAGGHLEVAKFVPGQVEPEELRMFFKAKKEEAA